MESALVCSFLSKKLWQPQLVVYLKYWIMKIAVYEQNYRLMTSGLKSWGRRVQKQTFITILTKQSIAGSGEGLHARVSKTAAELRKYYGYFATTHKDNIASFEVRYQPCPFLYRWFIQPNHSVAQITDRPCWWWKKVLFSKAILPGSPQPEIGLHANAGGMTPICFFAAVCHVKHHCMIFEMATLTVWLLTAFWDSKILCSTIVWLVLCPHLGQVQAQCDIQNLLMRWKQQIC